MDKAPQEKQRREKFTWQPGDITWLDDDKEEEKSNVERAVQGESQYHEQQHHVAQSVAALFESVAKRGNEKLAN